MPYIYYSIFGLMFWIVYAVIKHNLTISSFKGLIYSSIPTATLPSNTPCWFFISLFAVNIFYYLLNYVSKNYFKTSIGGGILLIISTICAYLTHNVPQYFGIGNICLGLFFFHIGYLIKVYESYFNRLGVFIISIFIYFLIGYLCPEQLAFVFNLLVQGNYLLNLLFSVAAFIVLWYLIQRVPDKILKKNYFTFIGFNSLLLFAYHRPVLNYIFTPLLQRFIPGCTYPVFLCVSLIGLLIGYHFLLLIIRKYCPALIGE